MTIAAASTSVSDHGISAGFEWDEGCNAIIEQIALTDVVESDWPTLRDIIKHKLHQNITAFLARPPPPPLPALPTPASSETPAGLQPSLLAHSPVAPDASHFSATNGLVAMPPTAAVKQEGVKTEEVGLVDAVMADSSSEGLVKTEEPDPVPAVNGAAAATTVKSEDTDKDDMREVDKEIGNGLGPADVIGGRTLPNWMKEDEAVFMESRLRELLDDFSSRPPFTIQRLCELLHNPTAIHSAAGKYLRAIERTLLVTSSWSPPVQASDSNGFLPGHSAPGTAGSSSSSSDGGTPRYANTPIFSPIPFLNHDEDDITGADEPTSGSAAPGMLMSPLVLGAASTSGTFPSSSILGSTSASVPTMDLPSSSGSTLDATPPTSTHPSTLSSAELRVDEFDAGVIPSSILPPVEGADASAQPHLISARPRALSSTSDFSAGEEEPSSPLGLMRAVDLPDLGAPLHEDRRVKLKVAVPAGGDDAFDELPTGGEPRVVIPPGSGRKVVFESATTKEGEEAGPEEKEAERERRSASPTPDPGKIVAAKEEAGEAMKVDLPGEGDAGGSA